MAISLGAHSFSVRQLQYAVAVADTKSFRRAAERCYVSQPSLSAQVAELEKALDVKLFDRDRRGVVLTPAGEELTRRARRVLVEVDDLIETAKRYVNPLSGTLRIGVIPTIGPYLLPEIDPALRKAFPRLTLLWSEDKTEVLVRRIERGELDAAILALEAELGDMEHEVLGRDPFVLATAKDHPLARGTKPVRPADLEAESVLLLDDGHCFREQALELCSHAGAEELGFRATSLATLSQMVAAGNAITLLPELAVEVENRRGLLAIRSFAEPAPHRTLVLAWRRKSALSDSLRKLAAAGRAALSKQGARRPERPRAADGNTRK